MKRARMLFAAAILAAVVSGVAWAKTWHYQDVPLVRCALCGTAGTLLNPLQRHHIAPVEAFPELKDDPTNIIVLCARAHRELGHLGDTHFYNPDVLKIIAMCTNKLANVKRENVK